MRDMRNIDNKQPVARKDHICDLCGCTIPKGERYNCQTNEDGYIYKFRSHVACDDVAGGLEMYAECYGEGLSSEEFQEWIDEYVYDNHYDDDIDDVAAEWQGLSMYEKVLKINEELKD